MAQAKAISKTITSLLDLRKRFNLTPTTNEQFSSEFTQDLPELTDKVRYASLSPRWRQLIQR